MTNPPSLCLKGAVLQRESQNLLAEIDSWGGTIHESRLAGLREAIRQAQDSDSAAADTSAETR